MRVELLRCRERDQPVDRGLGGKGEPGDAPGSQMAFPPGSHFALVEELGGRERNIPFRREKEGDARSERVGPGVGVGEGQN
jgi:hypothetical protein